MLHSFTPPKAQGPSLEVASEINHTCTFPPDDTYVTNNDFKDSAVDNAEPFLNQEWPP
jgi:hypothetical protein